MAMQYLIAVTIECILVLRNGVQIIIQEFIYYNDGSIGYLNRPIIYVQ